MEINCRPSGKKNKKLNNRPTQFRLNIGKTYFQKIEILISKFSITDRIIEFHILVKHTFHILHTYQYIILHIDLNVNSVIS